MERQISVIIPTYNRRPILQKCLKSLASQSLPADRFEVVLVDDGSTDHTQEMVAGLDLPYRLVYHYQERKGPAAARNQAIQLAGAPLLVFIDSDIVVVPVFLQAHLDAHTQPNLIGHGPVIHTNDLDNPTDATYKVTDISRAFFATGNASIMRKHLLEAGMFDEDFVEYGWEDLELGLRLRGLGLRAVKVPDAAGYHYKKRLSAADVPQWKQRERERGHTAVLFYRKVPTFQVRMMTLLTPVAFWLDRLITLGDWPERIHLEKRLPAMEAGGRHLALRFFVRILTFHAYMEGLREALSAEARSS